MIMNETELEGCFKLLRAYWPGEWDEARYMVWAEALQDYPFDVCRNAIVHMGRTERWPSVSTFLEVVTNTLTCPERGRFIPGTGWAKVHDSLEAGTARHTGRQAPVVDFASMRAKLRDRPA